MKRTILTCAAAALVALPVFAEEKQQSSSSSTVITNSDGEATVTIDVNGKKETKTFKLGEGGPTKIEVKNGVVTSSNKKEKVTYLGVAPGEVSDDLRAHLPLKNGEGISVTHVAEGGPAAKAGIQEHDILLRLDDQILVEPSQLKTLVKMKKPGDEVTLKILRKGEQKDVKVSLSEIEEREVAASPFGADPTMKLLQKQMMEQMKGRMPGGVFHSKGIVIGPNGKTHTFDGGNLKDIVETARKQLEDSGLSKEQVESIVKSLGGAMKDAAKDPAMKDLSELFGKGGKEGKDEGKKDGENEKK